MQGVSPVGTWFGKGWQARGIKGSDAAAGVWAQESTGEQRGGGGERGEWMIQGGADRSSEGKTDL